MLPGLSHGLRIWIAMTLAVYAAFWLQLDSPTSAAITVGILAQPRRGLALSRSVYRFGGTIVGGIVAVALVACFGQDRVLLLGSFTLWLGLCVFIAAYQAGDRAYGAVLCGYTVAMIMVANIDLPQDIAERELSEHGISLLSDFRKPVPFVNGDRIQLQQVMLNLIINAVQSMKDTAKDERMLTISLQLSDDGDVRISVGDRGTGLSGTTLERLFHPFFTTKPQGMGMGLSISRSLIESHGGRIWAEPNLRRGVTFYVSLPAAESSSVN